MANTAASHKDNEGRTWGRGTGKSVGPHLSSYVLPAFLRTVDPMGREEQFDARKATTLVSEPPSVPFCVGGRHVAVKVNVQDRFFASAGRKRDAEAAGAAIRRRGSSLGWLRAGSHRPRHGPLLLAVPGALVSLDGSRYGDATLLLSLMSLDHVVPSSLCL